MMSIIIEGEEYLNATESAAYLHVSGATFTRFQKDYNLHAITRPGIGRTKLFKKSDLTPLLEFHPVEQNEHEE